MSRRLAHLIRVFALIVLTMSSCQCSEEGSESSTDNGDTVCNIDTVCESRCEDVVCDGGKECAPTVGAYRCVCPEGTVDRDGICEEESGCGGVSCDGPGEECEELNGSPVCGCAAGFHESAGGCVEDASCRESTCSGQGTCEETGSGLSCTCAEGWSGEFCDACDASAGYVDDGDGGCTDDPCGVAVCEPGRTCVVEDGGAVCKCSAGSHEEDGRCVADTECGPNTCNDRGQCSDANGQIACVCDAGWGAPFCQACDEVAGYHADGAGGCTTDVCLPDPCDEPNRGVCEVVGGEAVCGCDAGYHDEGGTCVADQMCTATACNDRGQCEDVTGLIVCACDAGYEGAACESCAPGYHGDGAGGCTMDACLPNPCTAPNKGVCAGSGTTFTCSCDVGFHPDGAGGCTDDPCLPDLCSAQNMACRVSNGAAECYAPDCNDDNPCTDDALVNGACVFTPRPNGTGCNVDACTTGGSCQAGQCAGATALSCDDANPCTDDSCQLTAGGCVFTNDDTNIPDDGAACTVGSCSNGAATHQPSDALCDDGLWCSGTEVCVPADPSAGSDGCVVRDVPMPPATRGSCEYYTACDEISQSFKLVTEAPGTACDDGIGCTTGDVCDGAGGCRGTLQAGCPDPGTCTSTASLGPLDVSVAYLDVTVTYDGQNPATAMLYGGFDIWAVNEETGGWHRIADYYGYGSSDTIVYSERIPAGVYDLHYMATSYSGETATTHFAPSTATSPAIVYGTRVMQRDVVFGAGLNVVVLDVPEADIDVTVTYDGVNPETAGLYGGFDIWAVERTLGAWHRIANYYGYGSSDSIEYGERLPPGTYDLVYVATSYSGESALTTFALSDGTSPATVYGRAVLQRDVVISDSGTNTIVLDVPEENIDVTVTYDGQDPEAAGLYGGFDIWAVAKDSGAWHRIANYYGYGSTDSLEYGNRLPPGTYDLMYVATSYSGSTATTRFAASTATSPAIVYGRTYLARDVVVAGGNTVINLDVPVATITPTITYEGQNPETAGLYGGFDIWAVEKQTHAWHRVANYYGYGSTDDLEVGTRLLPGTYDLLYAATSYSGTSAYTHFEFSDATSPAIVYGLKYLRRDLVVSDVGTNAFTVDVQEATITPTVTYEGVDPEAMAMYGGFDIWAVAQDTGAWHRIANYYGYGSSDELSVGTRLPPGTYDLRYVATSYSGPTAYRYFEANDATSPEIAYGTKLLQTGAVVSETGTNPLVIDISVSAVNPLVTYEGQDPETNQMYGGFDVWAVARETDTWHRIANYYGYGSSDEMTYTDRLLPGVYDLVYLASSYSGDTAHTTFERSGPTSPEIVYGIQVMRACIEIP